MKLIALSFLCLVALLGPTAYAQSLLQPVDVPSDARSIAMGASFTGLPANSAALMYNPAGLAGLTGISAAYGTRNFTWISDETYYMGASASAATPIGVFAAHYNRLYWYTYTVRTSDSPLGMEEHPVYDYDVALGFARSFSRSFSAGIAVKYFDRNNQRFLGITTTPAWLFDGGIIYSFRDFHDQRVLRDKINLGLSIQNIGTKYKIHYAANEYRGPLESSEILPQYLRFGVSYTFNAFQSEESGIVPLAGSITGEWRIQLSPGAYSGEDFEGCGAELTFYEILTIRGGRIWYPYRDVYSDPGAPSPFRYGAGITIPLERIGLSVPFSFSAHYTSIPLWRPIFSPIDIPLPWKSEDTFSFEAHYAGGLW